VESKILQPPKTKSRSCHLCSFVASRSSGVPLWHDCFSA
jgi:hypothetical protein